MEDLTNNDLIDMQEDYLAEQLDKNLITEEYYNQQIDELEELRD